MNKYQNALDIAILNSCSDCENFDCEKDKLKKIHCDCPFQECIDLLQELVDKATPKKPIKIKIDYMETYVCPNCRHTFEGRSYCRFCGQALKVEDE